MAIIASDTRTIHHIRKLEFRSVLNYYLLYSYYVTVTNMK